MKKIQWLPALVMLFPFYSSGSVDAPCKTNIYTGASADGLFKVELCFLENGNILYVQTANDMSTQPVTFETTTKEVDLINNDHYDNRIKSKGMRLYHDGLQYDVISGHDDGGEFGSVSITNAAEGCVDGIDLDPKTIVNSISDEYLKLGMTWSEEL